MKKIINLAAKNENLPVYLISIVLGLVPVLYYFYTVLNGQFIK